MKRFIPYLGIPGFSFKTKTRKARIITKGRFDCYHAVHLFYKMMFFLVLISNCFSVFPRARVSDKRCYIEGINICEYGDHEDEDLLMNLESLQLKFPGLARTGSIGRSVLGKELAYIVVREGFQS